MSIRTVEIICLPCEKCERAKRIILDTIKNIEIENRTKMTYELKMTPNLKSIAQYSLNAAQAPAIIVNGNLELSGRFDVTALKNRIISLVRVG